MTDISEYKVGVILSVEELGASTKSKGSSNNNNKALKCCVVNIGPDSEPLTVVTVASNVRVGSRVVVAPVGSTVITEEGDELKISKTPVGGTMSEGMLCDSRMLGWAGGAAGIAVQIPDSIDIGSAPPATKPRPNDGSSSEGDASAATTTQTGPVETGLFERKLTKEEKKKLAAEKRAAKKAAKEES